jgi:hypothetical protein
MRAGNYPLLTQKYNTVMLETQDFFYAVEYALEWLKSL